MYVVVGDEQFLFVFRCRWSLEIVDGSDAVQDYLQRYHAGQEAHRSVCWCFWRYRYLGDRRRRYLGLPLFTAPVVGLQS